MPGPQKDLPRASRSPVLDLVKSKTSAHHETSEPPLVPCRFRHLGGGAGIRGAAPGASACARHARCQRRGHHHRRRRRGDCGRAAARRRRQALCPVRGGGCDRRTLRHRYQDLRRALRSRCPLDLRRRRQSAGEARDPEWARYLSSAARPAHAHRPPLRPRRRDGGFSRDPGTRQYRYRRCRAQGRRRLRPGAAQGSRRMAADRRVRAGSLRLQQGSRGGLHRRLRPRGRARQQRILPPGVRRAAGEARGGAADPTRDAGDGDRILEPHAARSADDERRVPACRRHRHRLDQRSRRRQDQVRTRACPSASSTPSPSSGSAATITWRWS